MSWTLEKAKLILGVSGSDQDDRIQAVMDATLASVQTCLQRELLYAEDVVKKFFDLSTTRIQLPRYPVKEIVSVDGGEMESTWGLDLEGGWIQLPQARHFPELDIVYSGGYETLPLDLERAMWEAFLTLWDYTDAETGGAKEGGLATDPSGSAGAVSRVTVQDFGSVSFDTGASLSGDAALLAATTVRDWGWLHPWASVLQFYRSEHGIGLGVA